MHGSQAVEAVSVRLVPNPRSDARFSRLAQRYLTDGIASPAGLERRLRDDYPMAHVVRGINDGTLERWYAYRDGSWVER